MHTKIEVFACSIMLCLASVLLSVVINLSESVIHGGEAVDMSQMQQRFSQEELDRQSREAEILVRAAIEKHRSENKGKLFSAEQKAKAVWVSWIPWFFLAFICKRAKPEELMLAGVFPLFFVLINGFMFIEVFLFFIAAIIGYFISRRAR